MLILVGVDFRCVGVFDVFAVAVVLAGVRMVPFGGDFCFVDGVDVVVVDVVVALTVVGVDFCCVGI